MYGIFSNKRNRTMNKRVNIDATQGGGYCFWDEESKRNRFLIAPDKVPGWFDNFDLVPEQWGTTGPVGTAVIEIDRQSSFLETNRTFKVTDICFVKPKCPAGYSQRFNDKCFCEKECVFE